MKTKTKWIIVGLLILLSLAIILAANPLKKRYQRYVCGTNLRRMAMAKTVYSGDFKDEYAVWGHQSPNELFVLDDPNIIMIKSGDPNVGL